MNKRYEVLEVCLNEIEHGADIDTVLSRYPEFADELRPVLDASVQAKGMAVPAPSQEIIKRNRAKLLQRAAEMRESKSDRRAWSVPLRRMVVTLTVVAVLFISSTNLVRAASTTLPGDSLYPVKRTWEDVLLLFTFDAEEREALEFEHENERLEELHELFAEGRSAKVDFAGYVTLQSGTEWRISGITVIISPQTRLPDQQVLVGAAVRVRGQIQAGMNVLAEQIELLPAGSRLPEGDDNELENEVEELEDENQKIEVNSDQGSDSEAPAIKVTPKPMQKIEPEDATLKGSVTSIQNYFVVVDGIVINIRYAEVKGVPRVGAVVNADGYYDADGIFVAAYVEFKNSGGGSGNDPVNSNNNDDDNNANDDGDDNDNDNDDDNDHDD